MRCLKSIGICLLVSTMVLGCSLLSGCGKEVVPNSAAYYTNLEDMPDGYYVLRNNTYYVPYFGETTFDVPSTGSGSSGRVAWFGNDYNQIPDMHKGDTVVLKSTNMFDEDITIERFEDLGYTLGICGMSPRESGRFYFSTYGQDFNVAINSDAGVLCEQGEQTAVIDKIGGVDLRAGNISRAGTVMGLERGKIYNCDIYIGTYLSEYKLMADMRALVSMEAFRVTGYVYDHNKTITFQFPQTLRSGYYNINGIGMVRYLETEDEYTEDMDMNIPNDMSSLGDGYDTTTYRREELEDYVDDITQVVFSVEEDATITMTVAYQNTEKEQEPPQVKIIGDVCAYSLSKDKTKDNQMTGTFELPAGTYSMKIVGLQGRTYTYRAVKSVETENGTSEQEVAAGPVFTPDQPITTTAPEGGEMNG